MLPGLLIGTAILWGLSTLVVTPIANSLVNVKLRQPAYAHLGAGQLDDAGKAEVEHIFTPRYIIVDMIVLGLAGLIGGLMGYWFIGFSLKAREWPGLITFIMASLAGCALRAARSGV